MDKKTDHNNWIKKDYRSGLVSVIIPTFNNAELIGETLQSVFLQNHRPLEIIVVDDGSTDSTKETIEQQKGKYRHDLDFEIYYFYQKNKGGATARNLGITRSRGEYIQFLDSDDLMSQNKISTQIQGLQNFPEKTAAYGSWRYFERSGKFFKVYKSYGERKTESQLKDWISGWFVPSHSILWKRADILALGPWDENLTADQDGEYALRFLTSGGSFIFIENAGVFYRQEQNLKKSNSSVSRKATSRSIKSRISLMQRLEALFAEKGMLDADMRYALAQRYYEIARHWTLHHKELQQFCLNEFNRLSSNRSISASFLHRNLKKFFGFTFTQKLKFFVRSLLGIPRQFRGDRVRSIEEVCQLEK